MARSRSRVTRTVRGLLARTRSGVAATPRGMAARLTVSTWKPASRLASARSRTAVGWAMPPGVATSPVSTTTATSAAATARVMVLSLARRARRGAGATVPGASPARPPVSPASAAVALRAASRRARRCSRRASAASTAADDRALSGLVRAIAGAASSALRRSSARTSRQEAQPCAWSCSGAGVLLGASSRDARSAPRSGQGIVGSRIGVVAGEVGVTEGPLPPGEQHPDRADGQVEGCRAARVGEAGMAQQQAGALPFRQGGEGLAHGPLLLVAEHVQQRTATVAGLVVDPFEPAGTVQPRRRAALAPQPVVGGVQADAAQPRRDLLVRPGEHPVPVELQERLLDDVLRLAVVAEQPVAEGVQLTVAAPEQRLEPADAGPDLIPHGSHRPLLVWLRRPTYLLPCPTPHPTSLLHPNSLREGFVGKTRLVAPEHLKPR